MKKVKVAIISTPAIGNLVPAVEFANKLTTHDPRISATILIISTPQRPQVNHYIHSRAAQNTNSNIRFVHIPTVDPPRPDQYHSSIGFLSLFIDKHKPHVKQALQDLTSEPDSAEVGGLFVDMFCTSMMDVADELSIPCYLFFASPAAFLGFTLHMPSLEGAPEYSTAEFGNSAGLHELTIPSFANPVPSQVLPSFFRKKDEDGYSSVLCHAHRYRRTKGIVINTFEELEPYAINSLASTYNGVPLPPVYSVGPLLDHIGRLAGSQHEYIIEWLDDQPPSSVVFLCFGSMGSLKKAQVREIALGLERAACRFIWSLREPAGAKLEFPNDYSDLDLEAVLPQGFAERTAGIGLVCGWVPQVTILAHKAVGGFLSHCGWNSILESLWYGVPVATWPLYAEQQMNAFEMVSELELAVEIRLDCGEGTDLVPAEEVERGVRELMDGGDVVREKVNKMSDKCREVLMENGSSFVALGKLIQELCCVVSKD